MKTQRITGDKKGAPHTQVSNTVSFIVGNARHGSLTKIFLPARLRGNVFICCLPPSGDFSSYVVPPAGLLSLASRTDM